MDDYEKAKGEYENRPDVKERMAKERLQMLKGEVAAASREVVKATASLNYYRRSSSCEEGVGRGKGAKQGSCEEGNGGRKGSKQRKQRKQGRLEEGHDVEEANGE